MLQIITTDWHKKLLLKLVRTELLHWTSSFYTGNTTVLVRALIIYLLFLDVKSRLELSNLDGISCVNFRIKKPDPAVSANLMQWIYGNPLSDIRGFPHLTQYFCLSNHCVICNPKPWLWHVQHSFLVLSNRNEAEYTNTR